MIHSSCSLGWKDGLQMQHTHTHETQPFSHSLKALQSVIQFISPNHLYTLACRTVTLLLHNTIQNNWQQPQSSFCLITINVTSASTQLFFLFTSSFQTDSICCMIMDCAVILFSLIWLTDCHSDSLVFSLYPLSSLSAPTSFPWLLTLFFQWWWWWW